MQSSNNPFDIDTPIARRNELKETLEFAIADNHIFVVREYIYGITDDDNFKLPNWRLINIFGESSVCTKAGVDILPVKIYKRYKYKELLENNILCEQCKNSLIEYFEK